MQVIIHFNINNKMRRAVSYLEISPDFSIYLFINSGSGGNKGRDMVDLQIETVHFNINQKQVMVCMHDLLNKPKREKGFKKLKESSQTSTSARAIVCGGDGSVMWVVEEMVKYDINPNNVPIGVIPIGTGNDFSRALGWGGQQAATIGAKLQVLKKMCQKWITANVEDFDLWEMRFATLPHGGFYKISGGEQKKIEGETVITKTFCNYMSIGIDGRIGYTFDKYRTSSRFLNLIVYGAIGIKKTCDKAMPLQNYLSRAQILQANQPPFILFDNDDPNCPYRIDERLESICALNINSYMGGVKNVWNSQKVGISNYLADDPPSEQSHNDGRIQIIGWASEMDLGMERACSMAYKINQGSGPYNFVFKRSLQQRYHTYMQVDGQYYKVFQPAELLISKSRITPNGSIKVLRNII